VPAYLNVVDIAGLVKGAAEGQGLGNAFLSHISACDGIFHLCRKFVLLFNLFYFFVKMKKKPTKMINF
jgi:50S ribosome-binding GTPase